MSYVDPFDSLNDSEKLRKNANLNAEKAIKNGIVGVNYTAVPAGISRRDYFAGQALAVLMGVNGHASSLENTCLTAVAFADRLIEKLDEEKK